MIHFRQKIFFIYLIVFFLFLAGLFPFVNHTVEKLSRKIMCDRATELIERIQSAPSDEALVRKLKEQKALVFYRVSVISDQHKVLYDSHTKRLLGPRFSQEYVVYHPEVNDAFEKGIGYNEDYSELLGQKFSYLAKSFTFHGKTYVLRTALPHNYIIDLSHDFETGVLTVATAVLVLFSVMTWLIIHYMTRPIQVIIDAVKPYQEGNLNTIPEIKLNSSNASDEFIKLANTLNSLSFRIQKHIDTLTFERNEKMAILESLLEGVVAIDQNMIVTYANHSALKFFQLSLEQLVGQSFSVTHQHKCYNLLLACQENNQILNDTLYIKRNEKKIFFDIVAAPKKDEKGAILVLQDKTSHYKLLEMRKDFIANASHELKTPITIIQGFAEMLHDNVDLPEQTILQLTEKIVRNCKRMTTLIKDLLTLSDVENIPESRLIECDLEEIIFNCVDNVKEMYPDAEIIVKNSMPQPIHLLADPNLMEHAFINLIENAAKYSPHPANITISLNVIDNKIQIQIADKGIGIPEADLEHIFERFYTVDKAHSQKLGGSGLGLSIVETIIHKHFGRIKVDSKLNEGTTFTILIPIEQS